MKNTVFPHKFWRPFLDCMPQLFFRPQYVWFPVHLKGLLIPLWYETLVVNWQTDCLHYATRVDLYCHQILLSICQIEEVVNSFFFQISLYTLWNLIQMYSQHTNLPWVTFDPHNGSGLIRQEVILWTNDVQILCHLGPECINFVLLWWISIKTCFYSEPPELKVYLKANVLVNNIHIF